MITGVDYYPEHWDRALWEADADLMQKTGVQVVRLAEFAWSRMEPRDGEFSFEWLDEIIEILTARGMQLVLCTPTSCPPLWFYEKYPEAVQTEKDGHKTRIGIRSHRCIHNADYLRYAERIIDLMTKRYGDNPAVIAWQIDNELEAYFCFCENCNKRFRTWMQEKYGTLEKVNATYGNSVWSGEYSSWEQIIPPFGTYPHAWLNPSLVLDYNRFASERVIEHANWQAELIRKNCPATKLTTNVWFCQNMPNFYEEFKQLDFISYDNYPTTRIPENPEENYSHAFHLDMMRGVKQKAFWIMEQLSGGIGSWAPMGKTTRPGMLKGYALQAFAHGADTVLQFRWRTATTGAEMHWHGLIDHSNVPGRRFEEYADLCKTAESLADVRGAKIASKIAILYSPEDEYAFKIQPQTNGMYYMEQLMKFHGAFTKYGLNVDVVSQEADLKEYRIVVASQLYLTKQSTVDRLYAFVREGGILLLTNRSGVKNESNTCIMEQLPTVYRELVGAHVEEYDPIGYDTVKLCFEDGEEYTGKQWCDILKNDSATTLATYDSDFYAGKPAITLNQYGKGLAYYVGTVGERALYARLAKDALDRSGLSYIADLPNHVEVVTRRNENGSVQFVFNNNAQNVTFCYNGEEVELAPFEMKIYRQ